MNDRSLAGLILFLLSVQFLTALMVGEAIAPDYVVHDNAISDLGVIPETALLFAVSLTAAGAMNILGGFVLYREHRSRFLLTLFVLAGIGAMGAGLIPLDHPSGVHGLFALFAFLFFNGQAIASSRLVDGPMKYVSVIAGTIGLAFLFVHFLSDAGIMDLYGPIGHGGSERMIVYPALLWLAGFGGYLMGSPSAGKKG
ncbi:MAG: DUF998 domain-containing protein [Methanomassiliicoccus sp.]|nr:DUF998 domain-containing protein [Methanomassiliicoccus sp.]